MPKRSSQPAVAFLLGDVIKEEKEEEEEIARRHRRRSLAEAKEVRLASETQEVRIDTSFAESQEVRVTGSAS